jgi:WD40 repeat protein/class 3 adenylate cyclase
MLQIRLLGQFDVRMDGKRVMISSRAGQSLLAYLVMTAGTPHRREKLAGTIWPQSSEENARKNLRQELWRIRKAIPSQGATQADDYLLSNDFTLTFNRDADYWLDVAVLERPAADIQSLTSNLSLYQGELLPGFYDDWIVLERERIQALFESKMEQLIEKLVEAERWTAVQEQCERWLALGSTPEAAYRALMLSYSARGDMAKVSVVYQRCVDDLRDQFGVEPSAETHALYNGLLKGAQAPKRAQSAQPSGTVTFLFTDIQGSTRLLDKLGEKYAASLAEHHEILRAAIQKWRGLEVDTQGDAFFITFTRALDAVQCAAEAQRALANHKWPLDEPIRVRMGLHTGEPLIASTGYVGMDVHRAARIGDAGHGGQILLSQTTRELVMHDLPPGITIRDLGEHRLKDMKYPTLIYQLVMEDLQTDFPPLKTKFTGTEAPIPGEAPFKGLQYFDETDADLFFGRELLTAKLMKRLRETQFLSVIIGASGSGKSSLVRAGLIPALKNGNVLLDGTRPPQGSRNWRVHIITPTAHTLEALATELTRDSESVTAAATLMDDLLRDPRSLSLFLARNQSEHTLLVIDQFEELFTLCRDEFEREAFIDNLLAAVSSRNSRMTLVISLRADFYAYLAQYPELRDLAAKQQEYIGPMTQDELRRAIEEPAKHGHWEFEPGLVDLILRDVGDEPGALPLLSHALLETWKRRAGHTLTLKGYADAGGVHGAIAHTAESVYQNLSLEEQAIAHDIFLRLTELGEGTEDTRRRASFEELMSASENSEEVRSVLNMLADARLITLGNDTAEVAHEALIREWPTLREWLNQDREGLRLHRHLTEAAHDWALLEHDPGALYRGAHLAQAREWATLHSNALNAEEKAFLEASSSLVQIEVAEREAQRERELAAAQELAETQRKAASRLRIRNRIITTIGSIAVILALLAGMFGLQSNNNAGIAQNNAATAQVARDDALNAKANAQAERDRADEAAQLSFSRELAVQAKLNLTVDPERSILLSLAALDQAHTQEAENVLHEAVLASRLRLTLRGHEDSVEDLTYSPDGKTIATASLDKTARLWDAATGQELRRLSHPAEVAHISFSPDGTRLATGAVDGLVRLWDVVSGQELLTITAATQAPVEPALVLFLGFSPDGKILATTANGESKVKFWDPVTGNELFVLSDPGWLSVAPGVDLVALQIKFSPDGTRLAISLGSGNVGLGRIEVWDVATRQKVQTMAGRFLNDPILSMDFSPDGTRLIATWGPDDLSTVWDVASGDFLFSLTLGNSGNDIRYSVDGKRLLSAGSGGRVQVFDAETGDELMTLVGHTGIITKVSERPGCVQPPAAPFEWCGTHLASASTDGTVRVWDISPTGNGELLTVPGSDFVLNEDGTRLSTVIFPPYDPEGAAVSIQAWDLPAGPYSVESSGYASSSIKIGAGYRWIFLFPAGILGAGFDNAPYKFWDVLAEGKAVYSISCCVDTDGIFTWISGRHEPRAAVGDSRTGMVMIWDLANDEQIKTFQVAGPNELHQVYISPDGERLATVNVDTSVHIWDVAAGLKLLSLPGSAALNRDLWFSPDGKWLAISNCNGTVVVWDVASGEAKLRFSGTSGCINAIGLSSDGKLFAVNAGNRGLKILDFETGQELLTLPGGFDVGFTPDGTRVITSNLDEQGQEIVRTYLLHLEDIVTLAKTRVTRSFTTEECQKYLHMARCPSKP